MPAVSPVSTDEIYEKYLKKAIAEINELGREIARVAGAERAPVLGSGHPQADIFLLKYGPQTAGAVADVQRRAGITADGEYGPSTLQVMSWPTTSDSGVTRCVKGASSSSAASGDSGGSSSLPPTD